MENRRSDQESQGNVLTNTSLSTKLNPCFPFVQIRKWLRFSECDDCVTFRRDTRNAHGDHKKTVAVRTEMRKHVLFVLEQRSAFWAKRTKACLRPNESLSVIIDGAESSRYSVPSTCDESHTTAGQWKPRMHVMGALVHGFGAFAGLYSDSCKAGHNVTCHALVRVLCLVANKRGGLPPHLNLQLDNTVRQCKGQYICGFLAWLILKGIFESITVGYLPVGHTHEDIDQFFSRSPQWLIVFLC
jgi:hypothetical protein